MKVALLTDGIWPFVIGGMQKHSFYLAKYLARSKVHVDLYHCIAGETDPNLSKVFTGEELQFISSYIVEFPSLRFFPGHYVVESYIYSKKIYNALCNRINEYDFVYVQGFCGWHLLRQKKKGNTHWPKVGVNFHGYEMFQKINGKVLLSTLMLRRPVIDCINLADVVFSLGGKLTDIIKSYTSSPGKIEEIPIGIDDNWLSASQSTPVNKLRSFLFIGRYERRKGLDELNAALFLMAEKDLDFHFHFIGPIPESMMVSSRAFTYHGPIRDQQEIIKIMDICDVLVLPSLAEGMPTVILEGMARGLAIIGTDVGAVNELVDEANGWLIPAGDPEVLSKVIQLAIETEDSQLLKKKHVSLAKVQSGYRWSEIMKRTLAFIRDCSKEPRNAIIKE